MRGVPTKPVAILNLEYCTMRARREAAALMCAGVEKRLNCRQTVREVIVSGAKRPFGVMYSSWKRRFSFVASVV